MAASMVPIAGATRGGGRNGGWPAPGNPPPLENGPFGPPPADAVPNAMGPPPAADGPLPEKWCAQI